MRPAAFVLMGLTCVAACSEPPPGVQQTDVLWMEWPAEVIAQQPFRTRLIVSFQCGVEGFRPGASVDQSAVTFAPYFLEHKQILCPLENRVLSLDIWGAIDTAGTVPGLPANYPRTYEMRASASVNAPVPGPADALPVRTFGDVTVHVSSVVLPDRRNAAGDAWAIRDSAGCLRLQPIGMFLPPSGLLPIENPADTTQYASHFVRGYIYDAAAAVCGQTRVFHLVSQN
jgi:hypothetical protein